MAYPPSMAIREHRTLSPDQGGTKAKKAEAGRWGVGEEEQKESFIQRKSPASHTERHPKQAVEPHVRSDPI